MNLKTRSFIQHLNQNQVQEVKKTGIPSSSILGVTPQNSRNITLGNRIPKL